MKEHLDTNGEVIISYCVDVILTQPHNPLLVAVTGESGSGKSYFTKMLES